MSRLERERERGAVRERERDNLPGDCFNIPLRASNCDDDDADADDDDDNVASGSGAR